MGAARLARAVLFFFPEVPAGSRPESGASSPGFLRWLRAALRAFNTATVTVHWWQEVLTGKTDGNDSLTDCADFYAVRPI